MPGFVARTTALAAVSLVGVAGCSFGSGSRPPVSAAELQKALVSHLDQEGTPTAWVNCGKDLPARVGATTRCEVMFNQADAVTAILTTTEVQGDAVSWEITRPEMTKDQVTKRVAARWQTDAVTCTSGLDGNIGDWAQCDVTKDGMPMAQTLEVKAVQGLSLDITPTLSMAKQQAEDLLRSRVAVPEGQGLESVTCPGDLVGSSGTTMDCTVTIAGWPQTYTLNIFDAGNGTVNFVAAVPAGPVEMAPETVPVEAAPQTGVNIAPEPQYQAPVQAAPPPAPVRSAPKSTAVQAAPQPSPVEAVPHLPPITPHLPPVPGQGPQFAPGPIATEAGAGQVVNQASGG